MWGYRASGCSSVGPVDVVMHRAGGCGSVGPADVGHRANCWLMLPPMVAWLMLPLTPAG